MRQRKPGDVVLGLKLHPNAIGWALIKPPTGSVELFGRDPVDEALALARRARDRRGVTEVDLNRYADRAALARSEHAKHDNLLEHWELVERTRRALLADGFTVRVREFR